MATPAEDAGIGPHPSGTLAADGDGMAPTATSTPAPASAFAASSVKDLPVRTVDPDIAGLPTTPVGPGSSTAPRGASRPDSHTLVARTFDDVVANVRRAYIGRDSTVRLALCCLMAEGHLLVEDHPGVGKTTLAKALARSLGLTFGRVQFTADLLPADVTGAMVFDRDSGRITFRPGPVFTNILLADELNRASPKAQSALLESMEEHQVSADGVSHPLPHPFMVIATQNPYDAAGTFPLPHSQRDRFLLRLSLGYPDRASEDELLATALTRPSPDSLSGVGGAGFLSTFAGAVQRAYVAPEVRGYVLDLIGETRSHPDLTVGASPRATLSVLRAAGAVAVSSVATS